MTPDKLLFALVLFLATGCGSVPLKLNPTVLYKRDMSISFGGQSYVGTAVLPESQNYQITFETKGKLDLLTITTCHRELTAENLSGGLFGKNRYTFNYSPIPGIEDEYCPIDIGGYEALKGRHSWGFIDLKTRDVSVSAVLRCNGEIQNTNGVSLCQSKQGLIQKIEFQEEMAAGNSGFCPKMKSEDLKHYEFEVGEGVCVYKFKSRNGEYHRLTSIGYQDIVLKEAP